MERHYLHSSSIDLELLLKRLEGLLASIGDSLAAEDELSAQLPVSRHFPGLLDFLVNKRVVVLEVGTKTLSLKSSPDGELQHGGTVASPNGEPGEVVVSIPYHPRLTLSSRRNVPTYLSAYSANLACRPSTTS